MPWPSWPKPPQPTEVLAAELFTDKDKTACFGILILLEQLDDLQNSLTIEIQELAPSLWCFFRAQPPEDVVRMRITFATCLHSGSSVKRLGIS